MSDGMTEALRNDRPVRAIARFYLDNIQITCGEETTSSQVLTAIRVLLTFHEQQLERELNAKL